MYAFHFVHGPTVWILNMFGRHGQMYFVKKPLTSGMFVKHPLLQSTESIFVFALSFQL
jgi:hypothetical protein